MAKVYFGPFEAVKYVGSKAKEMHTSLARPKPILKKGDITIVSKKTAFNLTINGFGEFKKVDSIEFVKADTQRAIRADELEKDNKKLKEQVEKMQLKIFELGTKN